MFQLDAEDIRYILQNAHKIKNECRCIECDGTGWYNYNENGEDIKTGKSNSTDRCDEVCEDCHGVGFKIF